MMNRLWGLGEMGKEEPESGPMQQCSLSESIAFDAAAKTDCALPRCGIMVSAPTVSFDSWSHNAQLSGGHRPERHCKEEGGIVVAEEDINIPKTNGEKRQAAATHASNSPIFFSVSAKSLDSLIALRGRRPLGKHLTEMPGKLCICIFIVLDRAVFLVQVD